MLAQEILLDPNSIVLLIVRVLFYIGVGLYLLFAGVVVRQISLMRNTLVTPFSGTLKAIGYLHLLLALFAFVIFIVLL